MATQNPSDSLKLNVDPELSRRLQEEAERKGVSMATLMVELIRQAGLDAIAEWEKENGAIREEAMEAARQQVRRQQKRTPKVTRPA